MQVVQCCQLRGSARFAQRIRHRRGEEPPDQQVAPAKFPVLLATSLDRGLVNIAAAADDQGSVTWTSGNALACLERRLQAQRERQQRRGSKQAIRRTRWHFRAAARNEVNRIAKHVVSLAVRHGARVSAEDLAAFAQGDRRTSSRAQYGHLLEAVERGLERRGYRPIGKSGKRIWSVLPPASFHGTCICLAMPCLVGF